MRRTSSFTLVEVLVAVSVLLIIIAMIAQMTTLISKTWQEGESDADNFTKARTLLDLMARDLGSGVFRSDITLFPTNGSGVSSFAFLTARPGITTSSSETLRNLSLVYYAINLSSTNSELQRWDAPVTWTANTSDAIPFSEVPNLATLTSSMTAQDMVPGVIDMKVSFVSTAGTNSYSYYVGSTPPRAVGVALAVVSNSALKLLCLQPNQISDLRTALDSATTNGSPSVKADWEAYLNGGSMPWSSYPSTLSGGLKIYERYIILPSY